MSGTGANVLQVSPTISTTSDSSSATVSDATGLVVGMYVFSANVPAGTTITAISGTTITLSANATATASGTAARFSIIKDPQKLGSTGGAATHTLTSPQMPLHGHPSRYAQNAASDSDLSGGLRLDGASPGPVNKDAWSGTVGDTMGHQIGGSGGDQPHPNLPPSFVVNYIIFAGA
jgi:hypothetical protein